MTDEAQTCRADESSPGALASALASELPLHIVALAVLIATFAVLQANGASVASADLKTNVLLYLACGSCFGVISLVRLLRKHRPEEPISFVRTRLSVALRSWRLVAAAPTAVILIVLMPYVSVLKTMVPVINPYSWDDILIAADRALFLGVDPWRVLQPIVGHPPVTAGLAFLYQAWLLVLYGGTAWLAFSRTARPIRRQYLLAYVLIWFLLGFVMATTLSSVGPCFVNPILGDPRFDAQMAYLRSADEQIPVMTLYVQDLLLDRYHTGSRLLGSGITAMPSMHVAFACLFWLAVRRVSARGGQLAFAFLVTIWVASVHLAYHYAIDGLIAVMATVAIWNASQAAFAAWDSHLARRAPGEAVPAF